LRHDSRTAVILATAALSSFPWKRRNTDERSNYY
jgi:hypothetical protein